MTSIRHTIYLLCILSFLTAFGCYNIDPLVTDRQRLFHLMLKRPNQYDDTFFFPLNTKVELGQGLLNLENINSFFFSFLFSTFISLCSCDSWVFSLQTFADLFLYKSYKDRVVGFLCCLCLSGFFVFIFLSFWYYCSPNLKHYNV